MDEPTLKDQVRRTDRLQLGITGFVCLGIIGFLTYTYFDGTKHKKIVDAKKAEVQNAIDQTTTAPGYIQEELADNTMQAVPYADTRDVPYAEDVQWRFTETNRRLGGDIVLVPDLNAAADTLCGVYFVPGRTGCTGVHNRNLAHFVATGEMPKPRWGAILGSLESVNKP